MAAAQVYNQGGDTAAHLSGGRDGEEASFVAEAPLMDSRAAADPGRGECEAVRGAPSR